MRYNALHAQNMHLAKICLQYDAAVHHLNAISDAVSSTVLANCDATLATMVYGGGGYWLVFH